MAWKINGLTISAGSDSTLPSGGWAGGGDRNIEAKVQQQQQQQEQQVPSWPGEKKSKILRDTQIVHQERHPASRRLLKQRSQESVRSGERRSIGGSIHLVEGEQGGRRSHVEGEQGGRKIHLEGEQGGRRSGLGGEEQRRSLLGGEEGRKSLLGGDGGGGGGAGGRQQGVALDDGKRIAPATAPIPQLERGSGREMEGKQGQARLEVKCDAKERKVNQSTFDRKVEERASTYLHWEETPSLPSPPATPPAEGESLAFL